MPRPRLPRRPPAGIPGAPHAPPRAPAPADLPLGPVADAPSAPPGPVGPTWHPGGVAVWGADQVRAMMAYLEPEERMRFLALADGLPSVPETFRAFIARVSPGFVFYEYAERLIRVLQDVADGLRSRVMVWAPGQLGKSSIATKLFGAYYLTRHPAHTVGVASYGADLARDLATEARDFYAAATGATFGTSRKARWWQTAEGGGMWATGTTRGAAVGRGYHLGIVDDPHKDVEDTRRERRRQAWVTWWDGTWTNRRRSTADRPAAQVICMTRWGLGDLSGELMRREVLAPERWHVVKLSALSTAADVARCGPPSRALPPSMQAGAVAWAKRHRPPRPLGADAGDLTEDPNALPPTCTLEPDWRTREDESVCEDRKPAAEYVHIRAGQGGPQAWAWAALYQQAPTTATGGMFRVDMFGRCGPLEVPWDECDRVRVYDLAATEGGGDWTVMPQLARHRRTGQYWVFDARRYQYEPGKRDQEIVRTAERDTPAVPQLFHEDPAQAGKSQVFALRDLVPEHEAYTRKEQGPLAGRAGAWAADVNQGMVTLVESGDWIPGFIAEHQYYGQGGEHDDYIAALSTGRAFLAARARARREDRKGGGSRTLATAGA